MCVPGVCLCGSVPVERSVTILCELCPSTRDVQRRPPSSVVSRVRLRLLGAPHRDRVRSPVASRPAHVQPAGSPDPASARSGCRTNHGQRQRARARRRLRHDDGRSLLRRLDKDGAASERLARGRAPRHRCSAVDRLAFWDGQRCHRDTRRQRDRRRRQRRWRERRGRHGLGTGRTTGSTLASSPAAAGAGSLRGRPPEHRVVVHVRQQLAPPQGAAANLCRGVDAGRPSRARVGP